MDDVITTKGNASANQASRAIIVLLLSWCRIMLTVKHHSGTPQRAYTAHSAIEVADLHGDLDNV